MRSKFDSPDWHAAVAGMISGEDHHTLAGHLTDAIGVVVNHEGTCLLAFHSDRSPNVLHHTLEPAGRKHYLDRYLAGPYLLDPLYQLAISGSNPTVCRFRDELPDRFRASEYYRQYCERTHLGDEIDYLHRIDERTTVALVVGRRERMFTRAEIRRLQFIEATVQAGMRRTWDAWQAATKRPQADDRMHRRLTQCFENFGLSVLTDREREISQLLLRGHSSKSVARELKIAPGTVMVHKRNLFEKLGISSQYELFSLLIDDIGRS